MAVSLSFLLFMLKYYHPLLDTQPSACRMMESLLVAWERGARTAPSAPLIDCLSEAYGNGLVVGCRGFVLVHY